MDTATQLTVGASDFYRVHAAYRDLKDIENSIVSASSQGEAQLEAATDQTDTALVTLLAHPTTDPVQIATKLAAILDHYDVLCFGLDREVGGKLFDDVLAALRRQQVAA